MSLTPLSLLLSKATELAAPSNTTTCEAHLLAASKKYKISLEILYAIGLAESGYGGKRQPFALNVEGKTYIAKSRDEAKTIFKKAKQHGKN